ncbi:hypothetical protein GCM10010273_43120 [Streptomyces lavendulocolor]
MEAPAVRPGARTAYTPPVPGAAYSGPGPHPKGGEVVGSYVHAYEPSRQPYQQIPAMRSTQDGLSAPSATPIYDALYSEYLRSFRTLPGDRSGEEDLEFRAFGTFGSFGSGGTGTYQAQPGGYPGAGWQPVGVRRHTGQHHVPAALPPAPRRGL